MPGHARSGFSKIIKTDHKKKLKEGGKEEKTDFLLTFTN